MRELDHPIATRPGFERGVEGRALPEELSVLLLDALLPVSNREFQGFEGVGGENGCYVLRRVGRSAGPLQRKLGGRATGISRFDGQDLLRRGDRRQASS